MVPSRVAGCACHVSCSATGDGRPGSRSPRLSARAHPAASRRAVRHHHLGHPAHQFPRPHRVERLPRPGQPVPVKAPPGRAVRPGRHPVTKILEPDTQPPGAGEQRRSLIDVVKQQVLRVRTRPAPSGVAACSTRPPGPGSPRTPSPISRRRTRPDEPARGSLGTYSSAHTSKPPGIRLTTEARPPGTAPHSCAGRGRPTAWPPAPAHRGHGRTGLAVAYRSSRWRRNSSTAARSGANHFGSPTDIRPTDPQPAACQRRPNRSMTNP